MIDVARYFIPKEDLLRLIDCISLLKINTLHLHLTDDNGWRIEIKASLLTAVGSRRVEREGLLFHERHNQRQGEPTVEKDSIPRRTYARLWHMLPHGALKLYLK